MMSDVKDLVTDRFFCDLYSSSKWCQIFVNERYREQCDTCLVFLLTLSVTSFFCALSNLSKASSATVLSPDCGSITRDSSFLFLVLFFGSFWELFSFSLGLLHFTVIVVSIITAFTIACLNLALLLRYN
jgi:hypothetical protein